jgi:enoyl-CoA hydratase/carnithine racemase
VAILRLDRPEKRNAVNFALHDGLERIFRPLGASVRAVTWWASIPMTRVPST